MRIALLRMTDRHWQVLWSRHHLLLDGWSSSRLIQEVMAAYQAHQQQKDPRQHPLLQRQPKPFREYITWLQAQDAEKAVY